MSEHGMKPIWYFVGLMLLAMGSLVFLSGIYQTLDPPAVKTVLSELHANIWWGAFMVAFGGYMYVKTRRQSA